MSHDRLMAALMSPRHREERLIVRERNHAVGRFDTNHCVWRFARRRVAFHRDEIDDL
jgi:hypothetical protein